MSLPVHFRPQIIVKTSKYCNLRCDYCFEFAFLNDKARMSFADIDAMFKNIKRSIECLGIKELEFVWHGGEPLLLPVDFYHGVQSIQKDIFGTDMLIDNVVQTNLTVLTPAMIDLMRPGRFFDHIGVSFDPYGDQRVDLRGKLREDIVVKNMQTLIDEGILFGVITVLAQNTLPHVRKICRFMQGIETNMKFLPFYKSGRHDQFDRHGLTYDDLVWAFKEIFDEWRASPEPFPISPIDEFVKYSLLYMIDKKDGKNQRMRDERAFVIDVDGSVYNAIETDDVFYRHGNLFHESFDTIVSSNGRKLSHEATQNRIEEHCERCPYYGACPGRFVANATRIERDLLGARGCPVRPVIRHIIDTIESSDLLCDIGAMRMDAAGDRPGIDVA